MYTRTLVAHYTILSYANKFYIMHRVLFDFVCKYQQVIWSVRDRKANEFLFHAINGIVCTKREW